MTRYSFPANESDIIFDQFHQVEKSERIRNYRDDGLSIPNGLIRCLNEQVGVYSPYGERNSEEVLVSRKQVPVQNLLVTNANRWANKKVLIADDEELNFMLLDRILRKIGITSFHAENGIEAIRKVQAIPGISMIFMDVKMPEMDGITATRKVKEIMPHIPITAQTAYIMPNDIENGKKIGFDAYLTKPISIPQLIDVLKKLMPMSN